MNLFQADEVVPVSGAIGETLEPHDACQPGDKNLDVAILCAYRLLLDRLIVERRQSTSQNVDHASAGLRSQMGLIEKMLISEPRIIAEPDPIKRR